MSVKQKCPHCSSENYDCSRVTSSKGKTKEIWGCKDCNKVTIIDCTHKHDQLILSIAEEMASNDKDTAYAFDKYKRKGKVSDYYTKWWALSVGKKMEDARIAVEFAAQKVRKILFPNHSAEFINRWLRTEGLIPEQEGGEDENI